MIKKYGDIISGSIIIIVSLIIMLTSFTFKRLTVSKIGPSFVPQVIAVFLGILGIVILINGIRTVKLLQEIKQEEKQQEAENIRVRAVIGTFVAMFIYVLLLEKVGFMIMTAIYLFAQFIVLMHKDERNFPVMIITAVVISISVYHIFVYAFQLRLPPGILG
ncbi:tripartite tricarboxylate transporter TctB family protein [Marispirochaeta sp.]|uniref:tripartite tricarboxylate transporter TctB family protein n=1 Tax=Marispirochaeta sp. TaxID=2038653 RepID=UPI0029C85C33|nr:tripartite tricarboxylate transporter TctB family protein [Marispirochaeta sp.]